MFFSPNDLNELLYEDTNGLSDELSLFKINALKASIFSKYVPSDREGDLDLRAKDSFLCINENVRNIQIDFSDPFYACWRDRIHKYLNSGPFQSSILTLNSCVDRGHTGPGSSRRTKHTHLYGKLFDSTLSSTSTSLHEHYVRAISNRWSRAEEIRSQNFPIDIVEGSSLSSVPKNSENNRTICTEPVLNMFYQLGAKDVLESVLKRFCHIDISIQPDKNRLMARSGSVDSLLATIDLKSASDMIHTDLVRFLLPPIAFATLNAIRSKKTFVHGHYVDLNMFSTMGNGFTFPLMTLIFSTLVMTVYELHNIKPNSSRNFGVFGDDIVCLSHLYDEITHRLNSAGFLVNSSKSFNTGFFRESCGGDFYKGHEVRGIYLRKINGKQDIYSSFNRLHKWSVTHGIPLVRTLRFLKGLVDFRPVPRHAGYNEGFIVCSEHLSSPKRDCNGSIIYRPLTPCLKQVKVKDDVHNFHGALVAFLGGYVRNNKITLRQNDVTYRVAKRVTPHWDYSDCPCFISREFAISWDSILMLP